MTHHRRLASLVVAGTVLLVVLLMPADGVVGALLRVLVLALTPAAVALAAADRPGAPPLHFPGQCSSLTRLKGPAR